MKLRHLSAAAPLLTLSCLGRDPLQIPPKPLILRSIRASTGSLEELSRFTDLTLTFDRAIAPPAFDAVLLVAAAPSDALLADAAHGELSAGNTARRIACRLLRDARDPAVLHVRAERAQRPDTRMTVIVTTALFADDDGTLAVPDAGARVIAFAARVAPARRCGPVASWSLVDPEYLPGTTGPVYVRFDRPVRVVDPRAPFLQINRADGGVWPSHAALGCATPGGAYLCASVAPARALSPDQRYRFTVSNLEGSNARAVEAPDTVVTARRVGSVQRAAFGASPACARDEISRGSFCVRVLGTAFELRALTTRRAVLFATATDGHVSRTAVGAAAASHVLRVPSVAAGVVHVITVHALGLDGRIDAQEVAWPITAAPWAPRVRIGEVLARPRGGSEQEFLELVNDEVAAVNVGGWALAQGASRTVLPAGAMVPARGRAVVVSRAFDPRGGARGDSPVASGAALIVLPTTIARGLRDGGEQVTWSDPTGVIRSVLPGAAPELLPRTGVGLVREEIDLADEDPAAWAFDSHGESTPGAPDALR